MSNPQPSSSPSPELLLGIINTIDCGLLLKAGEGGVVHANAWSRRLLGIAARSTTEEVAALGGREWRAFIERLGKSCEEELRTFVLERPGADGKLLRVVLQATVQCFVTGAQGETLHIATLTDMTHRDTLERQLRDFNNHLAEVTDTTIAQALDLKRMNTNLEVRVQERTLELREANLSALRMLAIASEARDSDTGAHVKRIQVYVELLAKEMGLGDSLARQMGYASILHDVGKIHIPDRILLKAGPLTPDERLEMESHTVIGERILSESTYFTVAREIARSHHENWDGSGYPDKRGGSEITLSARIVRVADVFDALTSARVYKDAWPPHEAVREIVEGRGKLFDSEVVDAFESLVHRGTWNPERTQP